MKFSLSWLKEHMNIDVDVQTVAHKLTSLGLEVESLQTPQSHLQDFMIAEVREVKQHPQADRLNVCLVTIGQERGLQVVCGASNVRPNMKVVLARPGTFIPATGKRLGKSVIRGVESEGMLCSGQELLLSEEAEGIIDLPVDAPVGMAYGEYKKEEAVFDINVTPNRSDATSVQGIARDLIATGLGQGRERSRFFIKGLYPCPTKIYLEKIQSSLAVKDAPPACQEASPKGEISLKQGIGEERKADSGETYERDFPESLFIAVREIKGILCPATSPVWMQERLKIAGLRSVHAVVDILNYVTLDLGYPLHAFDAEKLAAPLKVRHAKGGEAFLALNNIAYSLQDWMVVIADENGPQSIPGIIGGGKAACDLQTSKILLEGGTWPATLTGRTGRALGITTEARYRFERGLDVTACLPALERATQLILEICGGEASEISYVGAPPDPQKRQEILFPWSELKRLTGLELAREEMQKILERLGFEIQNQKEDSLVRVPPWRRAITTKADLVGEIIRIQGLEPISSVPLPALSDSARSFAGASLVSPKRLQTIRYVLSNRALMEVISWTFVSQKAAAHFGGTKESLTLANPLSLDLSHMRPSLLPGLLEASRRALAYGQTDVGLFECGPVFQGVALEEQVTNVAVLRCGRAKMSGWGRHWSVQDSEVDIYDVKTDLWTLLETLGVNVSRLQISREVPAWYHPTRSGKIALDPRKPLAYFGEIHPKYLNDLDIHSRMIVFELNMKAVPVPKVPGGQKNMWRSQALMPLDRDFSFIVEEDVSAHNLGQALQKAAPDFITNIVLFDIYQDPKLEKGKKILGFSARIQPKEKTLTDSEIEIISQKIIAAAKGMGATLRQT